MSQPLRIGIVGCGAIAREHVTAFEAVGAKIAWAYDINEAAAKKLAAACGAQVAPSVEAMASRDRIDAASICTTATSHLKVSRPFIDADIPILCEKPLEGALAPAEELAAAVRRRGSLFMVAFCHRFHPPVIELTNLIRSGKLGEPVFFRNLYGIHFDATKTSHVVPELAGGGAMTGNGVHSIDMFRYLVGEPTRVQAMGGAVLQDVPVEDLGVMHLSANDEAYGDITSSYSLHFAPGHIDWYGSKGAALLNYRAPENEQLRYRLEGDKEWTPVDSSKHPDRFIGEVTHFVDCVRRGTMASVTVEDGLQAQRVLDAAYRSIRERRAIEVALTPSPS